MPIMLAVFAVSVVVILAVALMIALGKPAALAVIGFFIVSLVALAAYCAGVLPESICQRW